MFLVPAPVLEPRHDSPFFGWHGPWVVFRVHMDLEQHPHHSLGKSGKLQGLRDSFWGKGRVRQFQGTWRRWHCTRKYWYRDGISEFSYHPCDPLVVCLGISNFSGSVSSSIKWEMGLDGVLWFYDSHFSSPLQDFHVPVSCVPFCSRFLPTLGNPSAEPAWVKLPLPATLRISLLVTSSFYSTH